MRVKMDSNNREVNLIALGMQHRAFTMELTMKRDQINQLRKDLETANYKIYELNQSLDSMKKVKEEVEFHFNISIKNTRTLEEKINKNKDYLIRSRIKVESLTQENRILKDLLNKSELDNNEKCKKIEDMETQQYCHMIYQKDIIEQNNKLKKFLEECNETLKKLKENQTVLMEESKINESNVVLKKTIEFYKSQCAKLNEENRRLENELIKAQSTSFTYKRLIDEMELNPHEDESNILLDELIKTKKHYKEEVQLKKEAIDGLQASLTNEKETNVKLWDRIVVLERVVEEMDVNVEAKRNVCI